MLAGLAFYLFTLLVFCMDGVFVASSGTWKATGVERRPYIKQPFQPFTEELLQLLPGQLQGRDRAVPDRRQLHMPFLV